MGVRIEQDSMGEVAVEEGVLWGAQTQRALGHFSIGDRKMPIEVVYALAVCKQASAVVHERLGLMINEQANWIVDAAKEVISGQLDSHFPLGIWISGSGTQCNMNVNEVISNRAIELAGGIKGSKDPIHPNDHVNRSQSTNDVFPTAMHIATLKMVKQDLLPALDQVYAGLMEKSDLWSDIIKMGRTHMQDAVPLTLGQEFSGYAHNLASAIDRLKLALEEAKALPIGGTAVGTGINAPERFDVLMVEEIANITGEPFLVSESKFALQGSHDALLSVMSSIKLTTTTLLKIANDIRLLSCGPRAGFNELLLPANEPGSSIMPGKVNPTQCEALSMVCVQVLGLEHAVAVAGSAGFLEMNAFKPLIIANILESAKLLADASRHFKKDCIEGMRANKKQISHYLEQSLMLVTALNPIVGYDEAAKLAKYAHQHALSLREANNVLGVLSDEALCDAIDPRKMV